MGGPLFSRQFEEIRQTTLTKSNRPCCHLATYFETKPKVPAGVGDTIIGTEVAVPRIDTGLIRSLLDWLFDSRPPRIASKQGEVSLD